MKIAVVYTINKKFIPHFTTSVISLLSHNASSICTIYLVVDFEPNKKLKKAIDHVESAFSIEIVVREINKAELGHLKIEKGAHVTHITYARLLISRILPSEVEKVLYLDSDTVVIQSLSNLFTQSFDNYYLIAVDELEWGSDNSPVWLRDQKLISKGYFNAGVMLIDIKRWRNESVVDDLIKIANKYKHEITFWDQDVLNIAFNGKWKNTDKIFNAFRLVDIVHPQPAIIHYAGIIKPWHLFCNHPYRAEYKRYRKKTPFKLVPTKSQSLVSLTGQLLSRNPKTNKIVLMKQKLECYLRKLS